MRNKNRLQIAYKNEKRNGWIGWLICKIKRWNVWHEEIIFPTVEGNPWSNKVSVGDSSKGVSDRDGKYSHPERWVFVDVYEYKGQKITNKILNKMWKHHLSHKGEEYGWLDIFFTQILKIKINNKKRWFCIEWSRHFRGKTPEAIGAPQSQKEAEEDVIKYIATYPKEFI